MCQTIIKLNKMKHTLKYLVKLLFVIILPLMVSIAAITLLISNYSYTVPLFTVYEVAFIIILLVGTLFNAIFYSIVMSKTRLLPEIKIEYMPMIGLGVGIDLKSRIPTLAIMAPLCVIEIRPHRASKAG